MRRPRRTLAAGLLVLALASGLDLDRLRRSSAMHQHQPQLADQVPHNQDQPPNQPRSSSEAARMMTVPPGFLVEVVAAEPDIVNPVAMTFDERGRVWITESLEYPRHQARRRTRPCQGARGYRRRRPGRSVHCLCRRPQYPFGDCRRPWRRLGRELARYPLPEDRDGDGKADSREVVATGFGRSDTHELPNSLTWGPDGWLYGWNGVFNPSKVVSKNGKTYQFTCAIFRIHPKTRVFEVWCEGTSNPWGIAIDPEGSFFSSACVIDHLWHLVETGYYIRQGGPYPPFTWPIESIVDHAHQKAAYCGIHYFDSPAYPPEYRGRLYMGNIHGNRINVDMLEKNGSTYRSKPGPDFLLANDSWFMPVSQKTGPDGSLYILDWYDRYHCYQDANRDPAGIDRLKGRLYRVRYQETPRRRGFDLGRSTDDELLTILGSPNVYDRETAQRILTERGSAAIIARLESLVLDHTRSRTARMHGLWARIGIGPFGPDFHSRLLTHDDATFRAWGVRAAGNTGTVDAAIRDRVIKLAADPSPDVRLQVAIAAGKLKDVDQLTTLLGVQETSYADPLIPQIIWQSLHPDAPSATVRHRTPISRIPTSEIEHLASWHPTRSRNCSPVRGPTPRSSAALLAGCLWTDDCRLAVDMLTERIQTGNVPATLKDGLRRRIEPRRQEGSAASRLSSQR